MGVLDKIKNALFEVEYVEVEDKPKKERKKPQESEKNESEEEKPIAKKIVLPGKKEEKVEEIQEEELKDEDFEVRPKDEAVKEVFRDNFNVMGDDDYVSPVSTPLPAEILPEPIVEAPPAPVEYVAPAPVEYVAPTPVVTQPPTQPQVIYQNTTYVDKDYVREYDSSREKVLNTVQDGHHVKSRDSKPYGMDPSYRVSIKEYGTENKDDKTYFKPSPIISPIYGILDKNYKKEDVVAKKEIRITSSYTRTNMNVDDIRNKAYGKRSRDEFIEETVDNKPVPVTSPITIPPTFNVEEDNENLLVDLSDEKKPEVKEITVGDAMEYFQDLGLEYNVDYVDASSKNPPKKNVDDLEEDIEDTMNTPADTAPVIVENVPQEEPIVPEVQPAIVPDEKKNSPVIEVKDETKNAKSSALDDDDNLFDLIDSMYREEDN